jgi:hypothetical protein
MARGLCVAHLICALVPILDWQTTYGVRRGMARPDVRLIQGATRLTVCRLTRVVPGWPVSNLIHRRRALKQLITYIGLDVHKIDDSGGTRRGVQTE